MRELDVARVTEAVAELCQRANTLLPADVTRALRQAERAEESAVGREILGQILENASLAAQQRVPMCQDTGMAVVWVEVGQEVHLVGGSLEEAVNAGVRQGYVQGYLRKSVVADPFGRQNTGDNTPAIVHFRLVPGDQVRITVQPKGAGAENMSRLEMLTPADGVEGVLRFVVETVDRAGPNACPPLVVGVGVGGTMEKAALLAKQALLRPVGQHHPSPEMARLEQTLLERINRLGVGPQGLGGRVTALAVHLEVYPTHIACLPVAVNLQCHADRHAATVL
ncbi:MAG: fumarate hydratase [Limnochordaceae bacterium]|nr:fumarate hydratase [Limnochordaceae bacterium]